MGRGRAFKSLARRGCRSRAARAFRKQKRDERREVVGVPLAGRVGLSEPDRATARHAAEEAVAPDLDRGLLAGSEMTERAVRKTNLERARLEPRQRALQQRYRDPLEDPAARRGSRAERPLEGAHRRTEPSPGTNGGLRWNGTRFANSLSACQWISVVTCSGMSG